MKFTSYALVTLLSACATEPNSLQQGVVDPDAPVSSYGMDVPLAYYNLSFTLSKRTGGITPPVQARIYAYQGLALYEAVVNGMSGHRSVASQLNGIGTLPTTTNTTLYWPLVASASMAEAMRGLWGDKTNVAAQNIADINALETQIANSFTDLQGSLKKRSIDFGHSVGAAIYQTSRDDGEDRCYLTNFSTSYVPPVCDGCWVPTAPGQLALQPFWKDRMTTFILTPGDCAGDGPPAFSTDPASAAYQEALEVYNTANALTPEQITIARYWADGGGTINGPGHTLSVAGEVLAQQGANLAQAAETYARVGLAVGDGVYAVWYSKYVYNWLRPITYIRSYIDATWTPLLGTPPFPEYTSAHSGQTSAGLNELVDLYGDIGYTDHTHDNDGFAPRTFASLTDSMTETALSRLYAGIHFHSAIFEGIDQGRCVANAVSALEWRKK